MVYDGNNNEYPECAIGLNYNANENCTLQFKAPKDMEGPIMIHYELDNFHQNHRSYAFSRDDYQLTGKISYPDEQDSVSAKACHPLNNLSGTFLNPCGVIANTFFNDIFTLRPGTLDREGKEVVMIEEGIAWQTDLEYRFDMPLGYKQELCPEGGCNATCCEDYNFSCETPAISKEDGLCYAYHYPFKNDTTYKVRYLHETYPKIISPLEHVRNEHFVVWMRVATRSNFSKLYGYIEQNISKDTILSFDVNLNYVVDSFKGSKALIISTNSVIGGPNLFVGQTFYIIGFFCLLCGIAFGLKHWFRPRKVADIKYLHYKED